VHFDGNACLPKALAFFVQGHPSYLFGKEEYCLHHTTWQFQFHTFQFAIESHQLNADGNSYEYEHHQCQSVPPASGRTHPKYSGVSSSIDPFA